MSVWKDWIRIKSNLPFSSLNTWNKRLVICIYRDRNRCDYCIFQFVLQYLWNEAINVNLYIIMSYFGASDMITSMWLIASFKRYWSTTPGSLRPGAKNLVPWDSHHLFHMYRYQAVLLCYTEGQKTLKSLLFRLIKFRRKKPNLSKEFLFKKMDILNLRIGHLLYTQTKTKI